MLNHIFAVLSTLATPRTKEEGATAVEYALIIGLVSVVVVGFVAAFGPAIQEFVGGVNFTAN